MTGEIVGYAILAVAVVVVTYIKFYYFLKPDDVFEDVSDDCVDEDEVADYDLCDYCSQFREHRYNSHMDHCPDYGQRIRYFPYNTDEKNHKCLAGTIVEVLPIKAGDFFHCVRILLDEENNLLPDTVPYRPSQRSPYPGCKGQAYCMPIDIIEAVTLQLLRYGYDSPEVAVKELKEALGRLNKLPSSAPVLNIPKTLSRSST